MQVPLLDLQAQLKNIRQELREAVLSVLDSTNYIMGPVVEDLEKKIAAYAQAKFGVAVSSGTDALLVALMCLDIKPGDLVITSPYSFFATAGVVARLGATPVFVDIENDTYNLDPEKLNEWFKDNAGSINKVKAIMPVHLYGQCANLASMLKLADKHNISIIEDAAQAIGAGYVMNGNVHKAGSLGTFGCFSFFPSKNLGGIGDGGLVTTNNPEYGEKLKILRTHGAKPKYYHSLIGGNFRLDPIQAAALIVKLRHLDDWHSKRQNNAAYYDQNLNLKNIVKPKLMYGRENHIYNQYVIKVDGKREELKNYLKENGIGSEVYYPVPFHLQKCFSYLGYKQGDFPNSEQAALNTLALPIYPELTTVMQDYVIEKIGAFYEH